MSAQLEIPSDEIERKVINVVADVLDRDRDEVRPNSSLEFDLGAESLDYLDMAFSLEREFNINFPRADALQRAVAHFGEDKLWKDGHLTPFGVQLLGESMPELDKERLTPELPLAELRRMFTVATMIRVTKRLLQAKEEASRECPECGGQLIAGDAAPEFECKDCHHVVAFPQGDDVLAADLVAIGERIEHGQAASQDGGQASGGGGP